MITLSLDLETTGPDPATARIVEIAIVPIDPDGPARRAPSLPGPAASADSPPATMAAASATTGTTWWSGATLSPPWPKWIG